MSLDLATCPLPSSAAVSVPSRRLFRLNYRHRHWGTAIPTLQAGSIQTLIYIRTYIHTCIHTYIHTYYIRTCIHAYIPACMHACMHTMCHGSFSGRGFHAAVCLSRCHAACYLVFMFYILQARRREGGTHLACRAVARWDRAGSRA